MTKQSFIKKHGLPGKAALALSSDLGKAQIWMDNYMGFYPSPAQFAEALATISGEYPEKWIVVDWQKTGEQALANDYVESEFGYYFRKW